MIIPDANLLLYAYDAASPFHAKASRWWQRYLTGRPPVGLCPVVLFSFVRVGTSRRAFEEPLTIEEASRHVRSWMEMPSTHLLSQEESDVIRALNWLVSQGVGGNRIDRVKSMLAYSISIVNSRAVRVVHSRKA